MDNKEFAWNLERRTKRFAVKLIRLSARLPNTTDARVIRNQITRAGTSIGANYREANLARSRADFLNKIKICAGEASETEYWMEIIAETGWLPWLELKPVYDECHELLSIFASIGR